MSEFFNSKIEYPVKSELKNETGVFRQRVFSGLEQAGFRESLHEGIITRMTLLEEGSPFNEYSRKIERGMEKVLSLLEKRYAEKYSKVILSKKQRSDGRVAAILHDIGKSGPVEAIPEDQEIIIKIFAREKIRNSGMPLSEAVAEIFGENQSEAILQTLKKYNIAGEITMRDFWDLHAQWTHDILECYPQGLNEHTRVIAGSHHIDRGIDPYKLLEAEVPLAARLIGSLEEYMEALEGRALIALDQYEAATNRGGLSHKEALSQVRQRVVKHKEDDKLMSLVLDAVDELGGELAFFS
jgi:hypothetical protein